MTYTYTAGEVTIEIMKTQRMLTKSFVCTLKRLKYKNAIEREHVAGEIKGHEEFIVRLTELIGDGN